MRKKVIELIENILELPPESINESTIIEEVDGWDSLAYVLIIGDMEDKLGLTIPLDEAIDIKTVAELFEKVGV